LFSVKEPWAYGICLIFGHNDKFFYRYTIGSSIL
jgi:hypothetical protein